MNEPHPAKKDLQELELVFRNKQKDEKTNRRWDRYGGCNSNLDETKFIIVNAWIKTIQENFPFLYR